MFRFLFYLVLIVAIAYFAATVPLGKRTLVGHIRAIWQTEEVRELKDGVKEKAGPAVDRLERGVKAGVKEATDDDSRKPAEANR
jgi:hypothetical protein